MNRLLALLQRLRAFVYVHNVNINLEQSTQPAQAALIDVAPLRSQNPQRKRLEVRLLPCKRERRLLPSALIQRDYSGIFDSKERR